jgi:hypothetical protein
MPHFAALGIFYFVFPALTGRENLFRASGASELIFRACDAPANSERV